MVSVYPELTLINIPMFLGVINLLEMNDKQSKLVLISFRSLFGITVSQINRVNRTLWVPT